MSNRKNYNSILFLTVYLGLVLVGATPQVMAYAATNSLFDLRSEVEYKDDLDNKPDNENFAEARNKIEDENLIDEYVQLIYSSLEKFPLEIEGHQIGYNLKGEINESILSSLGQDLFGFLDSQANKQGLVSKLTIKTGRKDLDLEKIFADYRTHLQSRIEKLENNPPKVIYENTKITFKNKQILIVTNLPRASIDSLLK